MILVTGATGTIGGELTKLLAQQDIPFRAMVRNPEKARVLKTQHIETVVGDLQDPASLDRAFNGAGGIFLLSAADERQVKLQLNAVEALKRAGVGYVVKVSVIGAHGDAPIKLGRDHAAIEQALLDTGITSAFLRPHSFMQNLLGSIELIANKGEFYGATGTVKLPLIDARDVAAAAAALLIKPCHESEGYVLTGPESISNEEVAEILGEVTGKSIRYVDIPPEQLKSGMVAAGMPEWLAADLQTLHEMWLKGVGTEVTDAIPSITGRPGRTFRDFAQDYAAAFRGSA
ncbi:MAG: SDR family oxidoreductase [Gemmatimonadales bacterium]|nr:SDR family oxidoreductase [Gemmatimonadales bacterium]